MPRAIPLFFVGAVLGTLLDRLHWGYGVLGYPDTTWGGQAWWVPLLFGAATLALVEGHAFAAARMGAPRDPASLPHAVATVVGFAVAYWITAAFDPRPVVVLAVVAGAWIATVVATRRAATGFLLYVLGTAVIGTLVEITLTQLGQFFYTRPTLSSVTLWLPALYLWAASVGAALDRLTARRA